jgi:hypothetical protein
MTPKPYFDDDGNAVGVTLPEIYDEPVECSREEKLELLKLFADFLDVPDKRLRARAHVIRRLAGAEPSSLRDAARKSGCPLSAIYREEARLKQFLRGKRGQK